ncbi:protein trichome birefringence-like 43 [Lotus japonicus]|uniref:protein trichome birefringence-like 43 n=1 Tax=Lotus japonicus TaxID=34305 RepID=UPI002582DE39|nr:protein trichome birefringence-like 43 [Lotus japonicus]
MTPHANIMSSFTMTMGSFITIVLFLALLIQIHGKLGMMMMILTTTTKSRRQEQHGLEIVVVICLRGNGFMMNHTLFMIPHTVHLLRSFLIAKRMADHTNSISSIDGSLLGATYQRFNGKDFLRRYRGKSIMFEGDSLSLNQWQSLTCMLHTAVPHAHYTLVKTGGLSIFTFTAYDVKVMFSRNAYLVDIVSESIGRVMKLDSIEAGKMWKNKDLLIFDSWHWWLHTGRRQAWDFIQEGNHTLVKDMDRLVLYEKSLNRWAKWVYHNVVPTKTRVLFQGVSPDHLNAGQWGDPEANSCKGQTRPLLGFKYPGGPHPAELVLEKVLRTMQKRVYLLNITTLSQLRKDAHPSVYRGHKGIDCTHWCLAGVPDTWNQLLYATLIQN